MSTQLTENEISDIKEAFDLFDDHGHLSIDRIGSAMNSLGRSLSEEEIRDMMSSCGIEGQVDAVDFAQFLNLIAAHFHPSREAELSREREVQIKQIFGLFDHNDDGHIEVSELSRVMGLLGDEISDEDARDMIREVDQDGDGKISLQEFLTMMEAK